MTDLNRANSSNLDAVRADGVIIPANTTAPGGANFGVTLVSGTTYFFPFGSSRGQMPAETSLVSTHFRWDAALIVTLTLEACNFPTTFDPIGTVDVGDFDQVAGLWQQENPTTGVYVSGSGAGGMTATGLTLVVAGGTAGGSTIHLGNFGTRRGRWRATVGGTGGKLRCGVHGKGA